ncbi:MAG TPA: ABATE domain-containing protein [Bryobacteraceae bacterium]|nr:ABATE domain-containing protein [Bryobacteraceae bacterium]
MKFIGGLPCLDFLNTVGGWKQGRVIEDKFVTYSDLVRWAGLAGLAVRRPARPNPRKSAEVLARARSLRLALHRVFICAVENRPPGHADLAIFTRELSLAREHQALVEQRGKFLWKWDDAPAIDAILWCVSQSAADLLTSPDLGRVRCCLGENCGWLFLDRTRNRSRHWCDMKDCGNLAKVRRFRARLTRPGIRSTP